MRNEDNNQLARIEQTKIMEMINSLDIDAKEKKDLIKKVVSDDLDIRKAAGAKLAESGIAQMDISNFLSELEKINKKGMYATATQTAKTGSGEIKMQFKGGDTKLIIPVIVVVGIVILAGMAIVLWR